MSKLKKICLFRPHTVFAEALSLVPAKLLQVFGCVKRHLRQAFTSVRQMGVKCNGATKSWPSDEKHFQHTFEISARLMILDWFNHDSTEFLVSVFLFRKTQLQIDAITENEALYFEKY